MPITNAMVLAAGLGTRLRPVTDTLPKPLVRIAGKPMIDYVLDLLAAAGVTRAVVNVHHFAGQMEEHLGRREVPHILISDERDALMNSGGGLAKGLKLLDGGPVLVMNADLFWIGEKPRQPCNLKKLAEFFDSERMDMALLCVRLEDTTGHTANGISRYRKTAGSRVMKKAWKIPSSMPARSPWTQRCLPMRRTRRSTSTSISTGRSPGDAFSA